jgi:transposase
VLDQAGWHVSPKVVLPEGLHLAFLPAYSPELQPTERLWRRVDEPFGNRAFVTLEAQRDRLHILTCYHWWPPEPPPLLQQ